MDLYENFTDARIRHLDMIQGVIARLGTNGFVVKGWAITVVGAFVAFAVNQQQWALAAVSALPLLAFWALDAHFLRAERLYRCLFDSVRRLETGLEPFYMGATAQQFIASLDEGEQRRASFWESFWRPALSYLYLGLAVAALAVSLIIGLASDDQSDDGPDATTPTAHAGHGPADLDRFAR